MPTHRIPVYLWKDVSGHVIALPVDADVFYDMVPYDSVVAPGIDTALKQVRDGLRLHCEAMKKQGEDITWPEPIEYEIRSVPVEVRPQYDHFQRVHPLEEKIAFRLPLLIGKEGNGMLRCCMPTISRWFSCFETDDYRKLAGEKYRETLVDATPEEILADVPAMDGQIQYVSVRTSEKPKTPEEKQYEVLSSVARPLLAGLRRGGATAYCREDAVRRLIDLLRGGTRNIALLAPEGAGRSTLLAAAVRQIERRRKEDRNATENEPKNRFWSSSALHLVAGAKYLGQWQQRLVRLVDELASFDGVLCVDNLAELARIGGDPEESVAAFLVPWLESGAIRIVGEITPWELDALQHRCGDFIDKFHLFSVEPLKPAEAGEALRQFGNSRVREKKPGRGNFVIRDNVPDRLVQLFLRFCPYQPLPGGASTFLRHLLERTLRSGETELDVDRLYRAFLEETGLPERLFRNDLTLPMEEVFHEFSNRVIGQDEACRCAAQAVIDYKAGMNHPGRPIRSMLFCGPIGVGKTQLAKTLGEFLFGNTGTSERLPAGGGESRFFRIDMSEYMHPWSAMRLIEQDDGSPSPLIRFVRRRPFSVILFDEIEKAAPEVFDLLLGLLDEGRLTDRLGRTAHFQSTIIVMTSNLGTGASSVGFTEAGHGVQMDSRRFLKEVRNFFRPEFFNRIDDIVPFHALNHESCRRIVRDELSRLARREGLVARGLRLVPDEMLVDRLVRQGFDIRYGARPLQRQIESTVLPVLARKLLDPASADADSIVLENVDDV